MTQITGEVQSIEARAVPGYGTFYDIVVDGVKYGNGKFAPRDVAQGDMVTFEYDTVQKGRYTNHNIRARTLRKVDGGAARSAPPQSSGGQQTSAATSAYAAPQRSKYEPFDERQEIISKQSAINSALSLANLAVASGAVLVPKSADDSKKLTLLHNWVLTEAAGLYNLTTGRTWDPELTEEVAAPRKTAAKAPAKKAAASSAEDDTGANEFPDDFADDDIPFD